MRNGLPCWLADGESAGLMEGESVGPTEGVSLGWIEEAPLSGCSMARAMPERQSLHGPSTTLFLLAQHTCVAVSNRLYLVCSERRCVVRVCDDGHRLGTRRTTRPPNQTTNSAFANTQQVCTLRPIPMVAWWFTETRIALTVSLLRHYTEFRNDFPIYSLISRISECSIEGDSIWVLITIGKLKFMAVL